MWRLLLAACLVSGTEKRPDCLPTQFPCESGQCVDAGRYCDGNPDCGDSTDEPDQCTNCNRSFYGLVGVKYPLRLSDRRSATCSLSFVAAGGVHGDRVEITFLSFQIGVYDFDSSSCHHGYMEVEDSHPVNPRKRSERPRRRTNKKGTSRWKEDSLASEGSFCGALIGKSATFFSSGDLVKLTVFMAPQGAADQPTAPRLFLTYRFLELKMPPERSFLQGNVNQGAQCDAVLTDCHFHQCLIRSPKYPGFYLRNASCLYLVREDSASPGKTAQVEVFQDNEFKINVPNGHTNSDRYKPGTLTSDCAGDTVRIYDGRTTESPLLLSFCGAGPLPPVRSSGPDMLVQLSSVPFQPLSGSHFELEVHVRYVRKAETPGGGCSSTVDGGRNPSGVIRSPDYTLPSGATCEYRVAGRKSTDRVWFYFASYHVPDSRPWSHDEICDLGRLEIVRPRVRHHSHVADEDHSEVFCEKRSPRQCGHASDFADLVPDRPCAFPDESYVTEGPELILRMSYPSGGTGPRFEVRYEVVDASDADLGACLTTINGKERPTGVIEAPKNVFLYGRGGSPDLNCRYLLEGTADQRVVIAVERLQSDRSLCETVYDDNSRTRDCKVGTTSRLVALNVTELWHDLEVFLGCLCDDTGGDLALESIGSSVRVEFLVRGMGPHEDFRTFGFRLSYKFVPASSACGSDDHLLSGSQGALALSVEPGSVLPFRCRWLLAALPSRAMYLTVRSMPMTPECANRILLYSVGRRKPYATFCLPTSSSAVIETLFTDSWTSANRYEADLTFLELVASQPGGVLNLSWTEVIRPGGGNPCPVECPELEACIAQELACDGRRHCPVTANDESPDRCGETFPAAVVATFAALAVALLTAVALLVLVARRRLKSGHLAKTVIPSPEVTRKSGLSKRPMR